MQPPTMDKRANGAVATVYTYVHTRTHTHTHPHILRALIAVNLRTVVDRPQIPAPADYDPNMPECEPEQWLDGGGGSVGTRELRQ